jgi:hypothetical protein
MPVRGSGNPIAGVATAVGICAVVVIVWLLS